MGIILQRILLINLILVFIYLLRPSSFLHRVSMKKLGKKEWAICFFTIAVTCLTAVYASTVSDWWSDKGPDYQFQYEKMTEAVMNGHLYLNIEISPELASLENPYDPFERNEAGASFAWDHVFYQGHYYMYFGVVPVFLLFIPLKLLGITLLSYQATAIFSVAIILGMFAVFYEIIKKMCPEMRLSAYLAIGVASSWISIWYAVKYPALYCTAISGGVCMAVWGFYFCYKGFVTKSFEPKSIYYTTLGAVFSALTFGCRPTVGLFCICLLPMIVFYYHNCEHKKQFFKTMGLFCIPFVVVAALLMCYNGARFGNPFEFGQSYQLTTVDQHEYSQNKFHWYACLNSLWFHFFQYEGVSEEFPFIHHDGCFVIFPILYLGLKSFGLCNYKEKGKQMVRGLVPMIGIAVVLIAWYHVTWAPIMFRRYSMDFYFLLCFLMMFGSCRIFWDSAKPQKTAWFLSILGVCTCVVCFLLFFVAYDYSIADRQPEIVENVKNLLIFWKK